MVEQDSENISIVPEFNVDGILKKMLKIFNNPSAPVCDLKRNTGREYLAGF